METVAHTQPPGLSPKDKVEFLSKLYDRMSWLTANADTKAGIILTIHSFWAISYGANLSRLAVPFPLATPRLAVWATALVLAIGFLAFFVRSASKAAVVLLPRTQPHPRSPGAEGSLTYYADIVRLAGTDVGERSRTYRARFDLMDYDDIIDDLVYRVNDIAGVVDVKYRCAGEAVRRSVQTFFLWAASLVALIAASLV